MDTVKKKRLPPGGGGGGAWLGSPPSESTKKYQAGKKSARTTWVADARPIEELDDTSRKILAAGGPGQEQTGTSIFDPVLCELVYRWFTPSGGMVIDPFAGGSVRGIVASKLGRHYTGVELRSEQVDADRAQAKEICKDCPPVWHVGDSRDVCRIAPGEYDLVFSCPPYSDLEVYSDDPADISNMPYAKFAEAYTAIIEAAVSMLRPDRFACFVVGNVRDRKTGYYQTFIEDTIAAFKQAGALLYNHAILVTAVGSLPIRCGQQFRVARKIGNTHQHVLIFCKGDPRKATESCGEVAVTLSLPGEELVDKP